MSKKTAKIHSEVKYARFERKVLVNHSRYHKITVKRFNRSDRQHTKANLKALIG